MFFAATRSQIGSRRISVSGSLVCALDRYNSFPVCPICYSHVVRVSLSAGIGYYGSGRFRWVMSATFLFGILDPVNEYFGDICGIDTPWRPSQLKPALIGHDSGNRNAGKTDKTNTHHDDLCAAKPNTQVKTPLTYKEHLMNPCHMYTHQPYLGVICTFQEKNMFEI
ncbi:hypothetical protein M404DRAFT_797610 [Pisolithus tinctorius Marx 270]|uniref:Uncharacterized protein n=1 Tax=Pisolithus tinctorius Marx 270 TaxID=870435 RepID=A0A0C3PSX8_PISTI|nr:hypothetical protein M404DRAFT_797610 [Pisolithus tinctorius Marx 270]